MIEYVVGIITDKYNNTLLIRKNRPDWQVGRLNGIGGHIEVGESPYEAMVRECKEECGLDLHNWLAMGTVTDKESYVVHYFSAQTTHIAKAESRTDEVVEVRHLSFLDLRDVVPPTDVFIRLSLSPQYKTIELVER